MYTRKLEVVHKEVGGCLISYKLQQGSSRLSGKLTISDTLSPIYVGKELLWQPKRLVAEHAGLKVL